MVANVVFKIRKAKLLWFVRFFASNNIIVLTLGIKKASKLADFYFCNVLQLLN